MYSVATPVETSRTARMPCEFGNDS
jgi:hypothetical protein